MEQFVWSEDLAVGIDEIDNQHKKLIGLINQLAILKEQQTSDREYIHSLLSELFNYTIYHFFTEEQIMENISYPEYGSHKMEHVNLSARVVDYFERFSRGEEYLQSEIYEFLKAWLNSHIKNTDTKLGKFIREWENE
ncbi:MAG: bacteriohemerythrin [Thermodesulfovibrionales bacterium]|nr:bacteriohemerythrin [Thermodesulfovibrionales bacterium]